jgi:hypothetical protein
LLTTVTCGISILLARDWPSSNCGIWSNAADMRLVPCGPHGQPTAPMPTSWTSPSIGLQIWYSASLSMLSPFPYNCLTISLSLLCRISLLNDSQFNISIWTQLLSPDYERSAFSSLESTSISFIISEVPPAIKVSYLTLSFWSLPLSVKLKSTRTISICYCLSSALFQWIEPTSINCFW